MQQHFGSLAGKTIAVWGLAFKPKTDDMREAPAIAIIENLLAAGARVQAYDPEAMKVARGIFGNRVRFATTSYDALVGADALALVTEWNEFREPDFAKMRKLMRTPVIFDGRNIYQRGPDESRMASPTTGLGAERGTVLVTGGAGYIGSHAAKALRPRGPRGRALRQPRRGPPRGRAGGRAGRRRHRRRRPPARR